MRRTTSGGRKLFTAIEARIRADKINEVHGTTLALDGGGPLQVCNQNMFGARTPISPWLSRQNVLTWLDAFELGIVYATKGPEAAADTFKPEED